MTAATVKNLSAGTVETKGRTLETWGTRRVGLFQITLSSSYSANGEAFDPRAFGFDKPVAAVFLNVHSVAASITRRFEYDFAAKKVIGFVTSTGVEIAAGQNLSTIVIDVMVISE